MSIYFASDHHFQHENVLTFTGSDGHTLRPGFASIQDHDNHIIARHNQTVKKDDLVYFLGDVSWKKNSITREILEAMAGRKRLVVGNHDDIDYLKSLDIFERVYMWKYFPEHNLIASHVPLVEKDMKRTGGNVHGHIHDIDEGIETNHYNVTMEFITYVPKSLDYIKHELDL